MKNHKITKLKIIKKQLFCEFEDREKVVFDMTPILREKGIMITPLKKPVFFKKAFIESGSVIWPNGFDICPNLIYLEGKHLDRNNLQRNSIRN